jgi:hypothetical protein
VSAADAGSGPGDEHAQGVQGRQPDRPGGGADLLRRPCHLPDDHRDRLGPGLIGHSATQPLIDNLGKVAPGPARQIFTSAIHNVQSGKGTAGILFIVGLAGALWSA